MLVCELGQHNCIQRLNLSLRPFWHSNCLEELEVTVVLVAVDTHFFSLSVSYSKV
jgi:hypothetical protein